MTSFNNFLLPKFSKGHVCPVISPELGISAAPPELHEPFSYFSNNTLPSHLLVLINIHVLTEFAVMPYSYRLSYNGFNSAQENVQNYSFIIYIFFKFLTILNSELFGGFPNIIDAVSLRFSNKLLMAFREQLYLYPVVGHLTWCFCIHNMLFTL